MLFTIIWMGLVFYFSHEQKAQTENTSSSVTRLIVNIIYGNEIEENIERLDPIIRKLAHYTLYFIGGSLISATVFVYKVNFKKGFIISQSIRQYICNY